MSAPWTGRVGAALALLLIGLSFAFPSGEVALAKAPPLLLPMARLTAQFLLALSALVSLRSQKSASGLVTLVCSTFCAGLLIGWLAENVTPIGQKPGDWALLAAQFILAALSVQAYSQNDGRFDGFASAALFGFWTLYFWQILATACSVPKVLLPTPSLIVQALAGGYPLLARDFVQTVLKSVLAGWLLGCGAGFLVGIAIDRAPFLQRGLLPLAALTSAVPLVGVAPIAVMWFGFDWPSKAAVVVLMTFFPMLVATLAGLKAAGRQERELMHSYAASYFQTLISLRLPSATPYLFSALKINAALALIGAIVAEFFGSPTVGLGFRISTEAAHMNMALVWAAIVVAAATGSLTYVALAQLEHRMAFWHPSVRQP